MHNCNIGNFDECYNPALFKWHVGMSMAVLSVGALVATLITLAFLGQMCCADCGSGERLTSLCIYLFLMISKCRVNSRRKTPGLSDIIRFTRYFGVRFSGTAFFNTNIFNTNIS